MSRGSKPRTAPITGSGSASPTKAGPTLLRAPTTRAPRPSAEEDQIKAITSKALLLALVVACPCGWSYGAGLDAQQTAPPAGVPRTADRKPDSTGTYQSPH